MKDRDVPIDRGKHVIYTKNARRCVQQLLRRYYDDKTAEALWEKVQLKYAEFLEEEPPLGGAKITVSMVLAYERRFNAMPGIIKMVARKSFTNVRSLTKKYLKKDAQNAANAAKNPGSFETKTMIPPEEGYDFSYHNLVCPLSNFAKAHGYEAYMPYLCNLDYVMFGVFGVPLYREHTCFEDGDYCDFKLKMNAEPMEYWPPVFEQGKGYK